MRSSKGEREREEEEENQRSVVHLPAVVEGNEM